MQSFFFKILKMIFLKNNIGKLYINKRCLNCLRNKQLFTLSIEIPYLNIKTLDYWDFCQGNFLPHLGYSRYEALKLSMESFNASNKVVEEYKLCN
jgi:hypothetical protein